MINLTEQITRPLQQDRALSGQGPVLSGRVTQYDGLLLECDGFPVSVGSVCSVETVGGSTVLGEVIG